MLRELHINDFVIVTHASLDFQAGFTVFSGETGAGKSILIDALSLALGERGEAALLREGAERADISALFDVPETARDWLAGQSLDTTELILRRVIDRQGRSRAYINGTPATLAQLRELGALLVDIHGQHAHQSLLRPASQRDLLDAQGGHQARGLAVAEAWQAWRTAQAALEDAQRDAAGLAQARERLLADLAVLDDIDPQPGQWQELCAHQARLAHAQALLEGAAQAIEALDGEQASAAQALQAARHALQPLVRHDDTLDEFCQAIESARIVCDEAASGLRGYVDRLEPDPEALSRAEQRMSRLFDAARRFQTEPEALPELHERLREQARASEAALDLDALDAACREAEARYRREAEALSQARALTARRLGDEVTRAMQTLAMAGGAFEVALHEAKPGPHGLETIEFQVSGHAGVPPRPLAKVASGGELARISLALSVIASRAARVPTLIFDEVDAGIGGAVAEVVGRLLRELGERHQVLCVTHLPQVAACAAHHFQVSKSTDGDSTSTAIAALDPAARVDEIARMLGGLTITDTTRKHAREMLEGPRTA